MLRYEYIEKIKKILLEDANSGGDVSPNGMLLVCLISKQYLGLLDEVLIDEVVSECRWLETYLMRCRHAAKPIDMDIVHSSITSLESIG